MKALCLFAGVLSFFALILLDVKKEGTAKALCVLAMVAAFIAAIAADTTPRRGAITRHSLRCQVPAETLSYPRS